MKNKILKIIPIIFILLGILSVDIYAVTYTSTDCTVKSEENITITVKASENLQNYDLSLTSYTGLTYVSCSANENAAVNSSTGAISYATLGSGTTTLGTYKFKAPKVTEDTTYNVVFDINGTSNTAKVTVKAEAETPTTPETPTVTEPKFTDANKTMYTTRECNLRSSWSTSSTATSIKKGTELKVTGTSTEKVNDYVWYRVSYNGQTKYIASYLLTSTKPEEEKKSDNAYLKTLTIEGQELTPVFNKETTSYTMQIANDITELNIDAVAEDAKATVSIKGNKDLKDGENTVTISVNAEDGTVKIYEIKVSKAEKVALGLKSLVIKDTNIASMFKIDTYEYEIDVKNVEKLEIEAIANDETATVEILGNEDLKEGENLITIIVSSQDEKEKVTYQIKANKLVANTELIATTKQEISPKIYLYIGLGVVLLIALIIVIVYTIKHRNEEEFEFSDNYEGFPEELPERKETFKENKNELEETQKVNYKNEELYIDTEEEQKHEEKNAKIDYFLDSQEDEKPRNRRGKHF